MVVVCFLFFKQKTAYEMRISDWSSDVCSSDLSGWRAWRSRHDATTTRPSQERRKPRALLPEAQVSRARPLAGSASSTQLASYLIVRPSRWDDEAKPPHDLEVYWRTSLDKRHVGTECVRT